jgi:hypothetical protein
MKKPYVSGYPHNSRMKLSQGTAPKGIPGYGRKECPTPVGYSDRSLSSVSPLKNQFEPTDASPLRSRAKMGGMT